MHDVAHAGPSIAPRGEPVWEIATLFPEQGSWSERQYLALDTNRLVEFDDGIIEVLPLPKKWHQKIIRFLCTLIENLVVARVGGAVLPAGYKLRIPGRKFREPDVIYLTPQQDKASNDDFTDKAELVIEIVSPDDPDRDYVVKREEYALAQVPEYWVVDWTEKQVLVLRLENGTYVEHGRFGPGQQVRSHLFPALTVDVDEIMTLGR